MGQNLRSADAEARFNAIVEQYGKFLRDAIARHCPKDVGIQFDDVEQEARLRLWRALQREREIANLPSYIYKIAVTTTIDAIRQVKARREEQLRLAEQGDGGIESPAANPEEAPDQVAERQQLLRRVEAGLASLPENRRRAVELYLQGLTSQEIAELAGWSEPKARNLLYRGLRQLGQRLRDKGIECEVDE